MLHSLKKLFSKSKSFIERSSRSQNLAKILAKNLFITANFSLSLLGQNAAWTKLLPVKNKNIAGRTPEMTRRIVSVKKKIYLQKILTKINQKH